MALVSAGDFAHRPDLLRWGRGLFGSPTNVVITAGFVAAVVFVVVPLLRWAVFDAVWAGDVTACRAGHGACWAFIVEKARFIFFGLYPQDQDWQAIATIAIVAVLVVITAVPRLWSRRLVVIWFLAMALAIGLMSGALAGRPVSTDKWSGFPLTLLLAVLGFVGAFPLGVVMALGRRSRLGIVRVLSVAFIEVLRGVPLIAVLYVSTLLFPLMLPSGASIDKLLRAEVAIILFVAAYMAEIVRAGLQALPGGQYEAARSLGLSWWNTMRLVVLPQALRAVIPSFVNLAIGIFLDTTLVIVIGLLDFLNTAKTAAADPHWLGFYNEAFAFAALVYFMICFAGSRYSLWLERWLHEGSGH